MLYNMAIVLGHEIDGDAVPDAQTRARLAKAAQLYTDGCVKRIMVMGWAYRNDTDISLAQGMKNQLIVRYNIPDDAIITNEESRDTVGDAFFSRKIYDAYWVQSQVQKRTIAVITSDYHMARTEIIFNFIYGDGYHIDIIGTITDTDGVTNGDDMRSAEAEQASLAAFFATFKQAKKGDLQSISIALYGSHPLYRQS